jgi:hypothetical protein
MCCSSQAIRYPNGLGSLPPLYLPRLRFELTDKNGQPNPIGVKVASGVTNAQGVFYIQEHLTPAEFNLVVESAPNFVTPSAPVKVGCFCRMCSCMDAHDGCTWSHLGVQVHGCTYASGC